MWVTLLVVCFISSFSISSSRLLYYKVSTGQVFGPFEEEQIISWYRDGYFQGGQVQVSERPNDQFSSLMDVTGLSSRSVLPSSKSFFVKLGKKAGATLKSQRKKLTSIAKNFASISPIVRKREDETTLPVLDHFEINNVDKSFTESNESNNTPTQELLQPQNPAAIVDYTQSDKSLFATNIELECSDIDPCVTLDYAGDSEQDLLAQLKRDETTPSAMRTDATTNDLDREKGTRDSVKYSVKSLPKSDYALWDAEDVQSKSAAVDQLLRDIQSPPLITTDKGNKVASLSSRVSTRRLIAQLRAVVLEIFRFMAGILMRLMPPPIQQSAVVVGVFLSSAENHAALGILLIMGVASLLRNMLYLALLPSVCALLWAVTPLVQKVHQTTAVMDTTTFTSAASGGIVTSVLHQIADKEISTHTSYSASNPAASLASISTYIQEVIEMIKTLNRDNIRAVALTSLQRLRKVQILHLKDVLEIWRQVQVGVEKHIRRLALMEKEATVAVLIVSTLLLLQSVLIPFLIEKLALREVVLPSDGNEESNLVADDAEDELLPSSVREFEDSAIMQLPITPAWVASCTSRLKRRVPAVALANQLRGVSTALFQFVLVASLLSVVCCGLLPVLDKNTRVSLVTPLGVSFALSVVNLYLQTPVTSAGAEGSTRVSNKDGGASHTVHSAERLNYLCDLVSNEHQWAECSRWGLTGYVLSLLAHEQSLVSANYLKTDEKRDKAVAQRSMTMHRYLQVFGLIAPLVVLLLSAISWVQLGGGKIRTVLPSPDADIAKMVQDSLRSCRTQESPLLGGIITLADMVLLRPLEYLQSVTSVVRQWGGAVSSGSIAQAAASPFSFSSASSVHRGLMTHVHNAAFVIAIVLVLPSLLQILQTTSLSAARADYEIFTKSFVSTSAHSSAEDAHNADIAQSLLRSHKVLSSLDTAAATQRQQSAAGGWSSDGPDISAGIALDRASVARNGRVVLEDVSLRLPAGAISIIVSPTTDAGAASALLSMLWQSVDSCTCQVSRRGTVQQLSGTISVQGREVKDWNKDTLSAQFTFLSGEEEPLRIQAGALAGCLPGTTGESLRRALRAQAASGAYSVIAALPRGPATVVRMQGSGVKPDEGEEVDLSPDQMSVLHLSRALCELDKPFVLLTSPTDRMSEDQERLFFDYLRSQLRSDQVVVVTTARRRTAELYGDIAVTIDEKGGCAVATPQKKESSESSAQE